MAAKSLRQIATEMDAYLHDLEGPTQDREIELLRIFLEAEKALFAQRDRILVTLVTDANGKLMKPDDGDNLSRIDSLIRQVSDTLKRSLVVPGYDWADSMALWAHEIGRATADLNMSFHLIDQKVVEATFAHVSVAEEGVLRVGVQDSYRIIGTVGADIGEFMRRELTNAVIQGLPTIGPGSLAERLFESGRLKPITIRGKDGRIVTRTVRQRAVAIARVESAKIANAVQNQKTFEVLGADAIYKNINPEDDRTTEICMSATHQAPMSMAAWIASRWGIPPRLYPQFHLCRSVLMGGTAAMFAGAGYPLEGQDTTAGESYALASG